MPEPDTHYYTPHSDMACAACRTGSRFVIPERHQDGPDQRLADLPDPNENTFDPAADDDGRKRR